MTDLNQTSPGDPPAQTSFLIRQLSLSRRDEGEAVGIMHIDFL